MNVSSLGGAASLPVPLSPPAPAPAASTAAAAPGANRSGATATSTAGAVSGASGAPPGGGSAGTGGTGLGTGGTGSSTDPVPGAAAGELRLPGQRPAKDARPAAEHAKEPPKPAPLPPLKGLTVAEIRAMLGVAGPPKDASGTAVQPTTSTVASVQTAMSRYA